MSSGGRRIGISEAIESYVRDISTRMMNCFTELGRYPVHELKLFRMNNKHVRERCELCLP